MHYFCVVLSKFGCAISNLKLNFSFVCSYRSRGSEGWPIFSMLDVLFSRWVFIHLSLHESTAKVLGMPTPEMKNEFTLCYQIINSLESVGMDGTHGFGEPWNVKVWWKKGINIIFCLGTAYDISSMESIGNYSIVLLTGKACHPKCFISIFFAFELWQLYKSLLPSTKGLSIYFMQFFWQGHKLASKTLNSHVTRR